MISSGPRNHTSSSRWSPALWRVFASAAFPPPEPFWQLVATRSSIKQKDKKIYLGNLDAKRDWGYAPEYIEAMWLMLQQDKPDDYVIATGKTYSVREFLEAAFRLVGIKDWKKYVAVDPKYFRPTEVHILKGDPRKAIRKINWKPKTTFKDLIRIMLIEELKTEGLSDKLIM